MIGQGDEKGESRGRTQSLGNQDCLKLDMGELAIAPWGRRQKPGSELRDCDGPTSPQSKGCEASGSPRDPRCAGVCLTFPAGLVVAAGHGGG